MELLGVICIFITLVYVPYWYECTIAINSLKNDMYFIENIKKFGNIDKDISETALKKFTGDHLWYMGYHLSALGFFDERISLDEKRKMVKNLEKVNMDDEAPEEQNRRLEYSKSKKLSIADCVSQSIEFFEVQ
ncbi:hypothetical protein RF55_26626 [Lasius niger]|uniref:Uncharacterized protein n=1 Tax=Lasius niger TaxID=67767 RepID=A0A0J7JTJ8_LASNI|nr:hypothetical protein RF55_26626 [Lasius niger]